MRYQYIFVISLLLCLCAVLAHLPGSAETLTALPQGRVNPSQEDQQLGIGPIHILDRDRLWAVGHFNTQDPFTPGSIILHSGNGGRSWEVQLIDSARYFWDVYFVSQRVGWVCGNEGLILKTTDGGKSWSGQYTPTESDLDRIQFIDAETGWATGGDGEVLRTTDGGLHWSSHRIEVEGWVDLFILGFADPLNGWLLGERNHGYRSTDGGNTWNSIAPSLVRLVDNTGKHEAYFRDMKFITLKVGFIAAYILPKVEFQKDEDVFAKAVLFKTDNGGDSWRVFFERDGLILKSAQFLSENEIWVFLGFDKVLHTTDGGKTWNEVSTLPKTARVQYADSKNGWATVDSGSAANRPNDTLYYTNDGGKNWKMSKLPRISNQ